jgi:hypothetical protein
MEKVINQFLADTETCYDESLTTISQSEINIHQLIDNNDGSYEGIRFQINNPTEKWYPERFNIIDEVLDYYETLAEENNNIVKCTIFAETIVTKVGGVIVNLFIKTANGRIDKVLDYRDTSFSVNEIGELETMGAKTFICNREEVNLKNNINN